MLLLALFLDVPVLELLAFELAWVTSMLVAIFAPFSSFQFTVTSDPSLPIRLRIWLFEACCFAVLALLVGCSLPLAF